MSGDRDDSLDCESIKNEEEEVQVTKRRTEPRSHSADDEGPSIEVVVDDVYENQIGSRTSAKIHECPTCGKFLTSGAALRRHRKSCDSVDRLDETNKALSETRRKEEASAPVPKLICPECGKAFTYGRNFQKHQNICEAVRDQRLTSSRGSEHSCAAGAKHSCESEWSEDSLDELPDSENDSDFRPDGPKGSSKHQDKSSAKKEERGPKTPVTCEECGHSFVYLKSFEKHQSKCSKGTCRRKRKVKTERVAIRGCVTTDALQPEGNAPKRVSGFTCSLCRNSFADIIHMRQHYSKSHGIRGSYPCSSCKATFLRLFELVRHQQNKTLYRCATCKKCYASAALVDNHEKVHLAAAMPHVCDTCGRSFRCLSHLTMHQCEQESKPCVCSYCGKEFNKMRCLKAHMVRHTGGFPCPICRKKFNQKTYLKWHLYRHEGKEPYLCETCGKGWPTEAQLKLHMVQHSEERPFKCEDCGACFKRRSHLVAHRQASHSRVRPFQCQVCGKAFRLNNQLNRHTMVHTGLRPFTCQRCGKAFTKRCRLKKHRERPCL